MTTPDPTSVTDELAAMRRIVATLDKLDPNTRTRVLAVAPVPFAEPAHDAMSTIKPYDPDALARLANEADRIGDPDA